MTQDRALELVSVKRVIERVECLSWEHVTGRSRNARTVAARHLAALALVDQYGWTYTRVAEALGWRDHSCVVHAVQRMADEVALYPEVQRRVREFLRALAVERKRMNP